MVHIEAEGEMWTECVYWYVYVRLTTHDDIHLAVLGQIMVGPLSIGEAARSSGDTNGSLL